jgi:hypothetical protein
MLVATLFSVAKNKLRVKYFVIHQHTKILSAPSNLLKSPLIVGEAPAEPLLFKGVG